jgi:hypothetical protein
MDSSAVKERILRLNKEIHNERFAKRDLSYPMGLWERAVDNYRQTNFSQAEALVDEAYRALYGGQAVSPDEIVQPQKPPEMQPQIMPVYVVYQGGEDFLGLLGSRLTDLLAISFNILVKPRKVFSNLHSIKPVTETLTIFILFGLAYAAALFGFVIPAINLGGNVIQFLFSSILFGFIFCFLASIMTNLAVKILGGKGSVVVTSSVYALSLIPVFICFLIAFYISLTTSLFTFQGGINETSIIGASLLTILLLVGLAGTIRLQSIGLNVVHNLSMRKGALAASVVSIISMILLGAAAYTLVR